MKKFCETLKKQPDKWIFRALLAVFVCSMIPLLYLSRYTVPGCDDYTYGVLTHGAWLDTHSLWEVLKAAVATTVDYWYHWQGTYSSIFLMTLSPGILNEKWYFLTTFIMSGMLAGGMASLVCVVLKKYVLGGSWNVNGDKTQKYRAGICVLALWFLTFQTMVAPADGLYWYNGALHYVFMESVLFFQAASLLSFWKEEKSGKKYAFLILSCFLAFVLGGANLLTGLQSVILTFFLAAYGLWEVWGGRKAACGAKAACRANSVPAGKAADRRHLLVWLPLLINEIGFAFNMFAPGNMIREGTAEGMGAVKAIIMSFYWGLVYIFEWTTPIVIAGFFLLIPVVWKLAERSESRFFCPLRTAILSYCVFSAMFTPTLFATSSEGPDRCKNVMRAALYLLLFFNMVNGFGWFSKNRKESFLCGVQKAAGKSYLSWLVICICLMGGCFLFTANKNTYTSISALRSIANGEAAQYYAENQERLALYNDESVTDVKISYLTAKPHLLFKADVGNEGSQDYWINISIVDYYRKNSVTVE